jgi:hypothetical protein
MNTKPNNKRKIQYSITKFFPNKVLKPNNKRKIQSSITKFFTNKKDLINTKIDSNQSNNNLDLDLHQTDSNYSSNSNDLSNEDNTVYGYNVLTESWHCTLCGIDMGPHNPRQLCGKYYCEVVNSFIIENQN